ncbi:essential MCU mitochondrial-like [Brachionus plicatilis]|uniref:Essential MCU regulator, mitochondrial n=1 Tax=Brachionus plicatilis TaxID=10195 RepID=A0A3M7SL01_BRAPC|nr:essential MCU mitochondrial-like [Brachionus plicatilis]
MQFSAPGRALINLNFQVSKPYLNLNAKRNILFNKYGKNFFKVQFMNQSQFNQIMQQLSRNQSNKPFKRKGHYQDEYHILTTVYAESGAMSHMPKWYPFGILKIIANIVAFALIGSLISKKCVSLLEEYDIFKPEDDEDDEDDD